MLIAMMLTGCATSPKTFSVPEDRSAALKQANRYYDSHEYYYARLSTEAMIEKNPADREAQDLMARVLDKEIERQKSHLIPQAVEEMDGDERNEQVKTWLERSKALFVKKQYDFALFAAEKVFLYDGENPEASELIDKIKAQALKEGKADALFLNKMYEEEIADRLTKYRKQAEGLAGEGYYGQARFTLEKILLLEPDDPKALKLYQTILEQQEEAQRHET